MDKRQIQSALNTTLSGLRDDPWLAQRVIAEAKGAKKVKKKISVGVVLAVVLIFAASVALAVLSLNAYYENVLKTEGKEGLIESWSAESLTQLVDWMHETGVELDEAKLTALHDTTRPDDDRRAAALELIEGYYTSRDGVLTSVDIIAKEKGPIENWSLEDRAWLSQMLAQYQPDEVKSGRNLLPTESDITREEAQRIFFNYYEETYGLGREAFDMDSLTAAFGESTFSDGETARVLRHWTFNVDVVKENVVSEIPVSDNVGAHISTTGEVIDAFNPFMYSWRDEWYDDSMAEDFWTIEGIHRTMRKWKPRVAELKDANETLYEDLEHFATVNFALPQPGDIAEAEAVEIATDAVLAELDISAEFLKYYTVRRAYYIDEDGNGVYFLWFQRTKEVLVLPEETQNILKRVAVHVDADTGEVLRVLVGAHSMEELL